MSMSVEQATALKDAISRAIGAVPALSPGAHGPNGRITATQAELTRAMASALGSFAQSVANVAPGDSSAYLAEMSLITQQMDMDAEALDLSAASLLASAFKLRQRRVFGRRQACVQWSKSVMEACRLDAQRMIVKEISNV